MNSQTLTELLTKILLKTLFTKENFLLLKRTLLNTNRYFSYSLFIILFSSLVSLSYAADELTCEQISDEHDNVVVDGTHIRVKGGEIKIKKNFNETCINKILKLEKGTDNKGVHINIENTRDTLKTKKVTTDDSQTKIDVKGGIFATKNFEANGELEVNISNSGIFEVGKLSFFPPPENDKDKKDTETGYLVLKGDNLTINNGSSKGKGGNVDFNIIIIDPTKKSEIYLNSYSGTLEYKSHKTLPPHIDPNDVAKLPNKLFVVSRQAANIILQLFTCDLNQTPDKGGCTDTSGFSMEELSLSISSGKLDAQHGLGWFATKNYLFVGENATLKCGIACEILPSKDKNATLDATIKGKIEGFFNATKGNDIIKIYNTAEINITNSGGPGNVNTNEGDDIVELYNVPKEADHTNEPVFKLNYYINGDGGNNTLKIFADIIISGTSSNTNKDSFLENFQNVEIAEKGSIKFTTEKAATYNFKYSITTNDGTLWVDNFNTEFKSYIQNKGDFHITYNLVDNKGGKIITEPYTTLTINNTKITINPHTTYLTNIADLKSLVSSNTYIISSNTVKDFENNSFRVLDPRLLSSIVVNNNKELEMNFTLNNYRTRIHGIATNNPNLSMLANELNSILYSKNFMELTDIFYKLNDLTDNNLANAILEIQPLNNEVLQQVNLNLQDNFVRSIINRNTLFAFSGENRIKEDIGYTLLSLGDNIGVNNLIVWVESFYNHALLQDTNFSTGNKTNTTTYVVGSDIIITDSFLLGGSIAHSTSKIKANNNTLYTANQTSKHFGIYTKFNPKYFYLTLLGAHSFYNAILNRNMQSINESSQNNLSSSISTASFELGNALLIIAKDLTPLIEINPYFTSAINFVNLKDYTEEGSNLNFKVKGFHNKVYTTGIGVKFSQEILIVDKSQSLKPRVNLLVNKIFNKAPLTNAQLTSSSNPLNFEAPIYKNYSFLFEGALAYRIGIYFQSELALNYLYGNNTHNYTLSLKAKYVL